MNREGQVWKFNWATAPFVVVRTAGSDMTVHWIVWLDDGTARWEKERVEWNTVGNMTRIA